MHIPVQVENISETTFCYYAKFIWLFFEHKSVLIKLLVSLDCIFGLLNCYITYVRLQINVLSVLVLYFNTILKHI